MTTQTPILSLLHACQAAFGTYNLYLASIAIRNLHGYEGPAETAARYSNTAKDQLRQTRTTQASGAIAVCMPYLCASRPQLDLNSSPISFPSRVSVSRHVMQNLPSTDSIKTSLPPPPPFFS